MSEQKPETQNTNDETQLTDEGLESVSGGVTGGGCIPTFPPTFPEPIIDGGF